MLFDSSRSCVTCDRLETQYHSLLTHIYRPDYVKNCSYFFFLANKIVTRNILTTKRRKTTHLGHVQVIRDMIFMQLFHIPLSKKFAHNFLKRGVWTRERNRGCATSESRYIGVPNAAEHNITTKSFTNLQYLESHLERKMKIYALGNKYK